MANPTVDEIKIRMYQVGFGDCFLMIFHYTDATERFVLVDFGSTGMPKEFSPKERKEQMTKVAVDISVRCGGKLDDTGKLTKSGKLHGVVATHRHADHISGFASKTAGTGKIIRDCQPDFIVMPWTENPSAAEDAKGFVAAENHSNSENRLAAGTANFLETLDAMNSVAASIEKEAQWLGSKAVFVKPLDAKTAETLEFMGANNTGKISNGDAVDNLQTMNPANTHYVNFGYNLDLSAFLPDVKVHVLGPPTIEQYKKVKSEDDENPEFWMFQKMVNNFWQMQAATAELKNTLLAENQLFPDAEVFDNFEPSQVRWFVRQMREVRANLLFEIVRIMDNAMNNTSVILLFEIGGKKLLFPGDAQIENWEYALKVASNPPETLGKDDVLKKLKDTDLYKVGHHGSRNATPHTLWDNFAHKSTNKDDENRLKTIMSTMEGKHGHETDKKGNVINTEVPRKTLVTEFTANSNLSTTQEITDANILFEEVVIKI